MSFRPRRSAKFALKSLPDGNPSKRQLRYVQSTHAGGNITESQQFSSDDTGRFFMRLQVETKAAHCLNDLLFRQRAGQLPIEIPLVLSNHDEFSDLARYMQILSPELCAKLEGRVINIHHSFLPGFKGANPYKQAHARGVKLIGATAHFVTTDLDEGPIIEQNVVRVDHSRTARELVAIGQDEESRTLTQAVKWLAEDRVLLNGHRTIIFR